MDGEKGVSHQLASQSAARELTSETAGTDHAAQPLSAGRWGLQSSQMLFLTPSPSDVFCHGYNEEEMERKRRGAVDGQRSLAASFSSMGDRRRDPEVPAHTISNLPNFGPTTTGRSTAQSTK